MMDDRVLVPLSRVAGLSPDVVALVQASRAPTTLAAYAADWRRFERWCLHAGHTSWPASTTTIAEYLAALVAQGRRVSTLTRARVAIGRVHALRGAPDPTTDALVVELMKGARRTVGVAQRQARPLLPDELRRLVDAQGHDETGLRNRALLVLGFLGALRRSELVALDLDDVEVEPRGLVVTIRRSKTDPEGHGARIGLPRQRTSSLCPVHCLQAWLRARDAMRVRDDALFVVVGRRGRGTRLRAQAVWRVVLDAARCAGVSTERLCAHSLRAGFATAAAQAGRPESATRRVTRHRSLAMLLRYVRVDDPLAHAAGDDLLP